MPFAPKKGIFTRSLNVLTPPETARLTAFSLTGISSPDSANNSDTESLLATINDPVDLRQLDPEQLPRLADELRQFILEAVSSTGGHLAVGLGTI